MYSPDQAVTMTDETSDSSDEPMGITKVSLSLDWANMTEEEIMQHWQIVENFTFGLSEELDIVKQQHWRIFLIVLYSIVILIGFLGNLLIVCVLLKNKHLHTVTNIFIVGLAISDIMMCVFNLPFQLHYQLTDSWAFGETLCKVIMPTFGVPIFVSSTSMLMIAIDRYVLIVHPFKPRMPKMMAVGLIIFIAILTTLLAVPIMIHTKYQEINIPELRYYKQYCIEQWESIQAKHAYTVSIFILNFFFPLVATSIVYFRISTVLRNRPLKKNERRRNHRTNKILISIVLLFSFFWLPWNLFMLISEFNQQLVSGSYFKFIDLLLKILAMSSACINPCMYGWLNDNFRKEFDTLLRRNGHNRIRQNGHTYSLAEPTKTDCDKYTTYV
ncbi:hypothetical protein ACJMK2_036607 [Sinanodonta woodiana]|uniref:G-protein coupled receptors family 1 profile domain-containing protein n=1 Tax=Sinanodonta woodiana TaxID=1069815 RepID=A0ABD3WJW1_SINWO